MLQASFYSTALKTLISVSTVILIGLIFAYHALEVQVRIKNPIGSMLRPCSVHVNNLSVDVASTKRTWKKAIRYKPVAFAHTCGVSFQKAERVDCLSERKKCLDLVSLYILAFYPLLHLYRRFLWHGYMFYFSNKFQEDRLFTEEIIAREN